MATTILIKSNDTSGVAPRVDELSYAELAINTADGHLYTRTTNDEIVNLTSWDQLYNKPTSFTPTVHNHVISDVTNLQSALDGKQPVGFYVEDSDPRLSDARVPLSHNHNVSDVVDLESILDNKQPVGDYVLVTDPRLSDAREPLEHTHTDNQNTFIGTNSLNSNISGVDNIAIGYNNLAFNETGVNNTSVGSGALYQNVVGSNNCALGTYALLSNIAELNTAIGSASLANNTTGIENVAVGAGTAGLNTTGIYNTCIGSFAGSSITTGSYNIAIGHNANLNSSSLENCIVLGVGASAVISGDFVVGSDAHPITTTSSVGSSGSAAVLPNNPLGYLNLRLNGVLVKIPYYRD